MDPWTPYAGDSDTPGVWVGEQLIFTVPKVSGRRVKRTYLSKLCDLLGLDD